MSSVDPPIKLKTNLPDLLTTVQIERYVTVGANSVRRRARCPLINNENDAELACKVYEEFVDICTTDRFDLNDGPAKFEYFRQCLAGQARAHWDVASTAAIAANGGNNDQAFVDSVTDWFAQYFEPTAFHDQKQYFLQATKAYSMNVKETATRLDEIIRFMAFMPGATAGTPAYSDVEKKMVLYRLMRPNWKTNFDASGNVITDPGYTWNNLITYMSAQEKRENRRTIQGSVGGRGSSGRGFGRGGRGSGRSGRGHGSSSYYGRRVANYQDGPPSQRFRTSAFSTGGRGYIPSYGSGYGRIGYGNYGRGYGHQASTGGYGYNGGRSVGRGYAGGRAVYGRGGRGRGRNGREVRNLHQDPGYQNRGARTTRSGSTYHIGDTPAENDGNGDSGNAESFDSGDVTQESQEPEYHDEMYHGGPMMDVDPYDNFFGEYGNEEEFEGYGDY